MACSARSKTLDTCNPGMSKDSDIAPQDREFPVVSSFVFRVLRLRFLDCNQVCVRQGQKRLTMRFTVALFQRESLQEDTLMRTMISVRYSLRFRISCRSSAGSRRARN